MDMKNLETPHDSLPVLTSKGKPRDDTGKRVVVNSMGGPAWPDNRTGRDVIKNYDKMIRKWTKEDNEKNRKRALEDVGGVVVWGPRKLQYKAMKEVGKNHRGQPILHKTKFITAPYWGVLLDGYNLVISFVEEEITF